LNLNIVIQMNIFLDIKHKTDLRVKKLKFGRRTYGRGTAYCVCVPGTYLSKKLIGAAMCQGLLHTVLVYVLASLNPEHVIGHSALYVKG
jgi:hypothetical protein